MTIVASTAVPTIEITIVRPTALSCSIQSALPTMLAEVGVEVALTVRRREHAGEHRAHRTADAVDTERVERVVVLERALSFVHARNGTTPASTPISTALLAATKPAPGVITTRPATAPEQKPSTVGLPRVTHSSAGHTRAATAAASVVVMKAFAGRRRPRPRCRR